MSYITDACANVEGFVQRYDFLTKVMQNESKSLATIRSYTHHLAKFCNYHHRLPEQVSSTEYVEYYNSLITIKGLVCARNERILSPLWLTQNSAAPPLSLPRVHPDPNSR